MFSKNHPQLSHLKELSLGLFDRRLPKFLFDNWKAVNKGFSLNNDFACVVDSFLAGMLAFYCQLIKSSDSEIKCFLNKYSSTQL